MIDTETIGVLRRSFSAALGHSDPVTSRELLIAAGWLDALADDEQAAVAVIFQLQGAMGLDVGALDDVLISRLLESGLQPGEVAIAYSVRAPSRTEPFGAHVLLPGTDHATHILWCEDSLGERIRLIERPSPERLTLLRGIDPFLGLVGVADLSLEREVRLPGQIPPTSWNEAIAAGRIALSHQINAGSRTLLTMAADYAQLRKQFDTPIASFQAIRHRLADSVVALSAAEASIVAAAVSPTQERAAVAKALSGRAAAVAAKNCLQVFGGIGFTMDHEFHRFFRRNLVLDRLLGDHRSIERWIGESIRTQRVSMGTARLEDLPRLELFGS